jgi:hypothetical protein
MSLGKLGILQLEKIAVRHVDFVLKRGYFDSLGRLILRLQLWSLEIQ